MNAPGDAVKPLGPHPIASLGKRAVAEGVGTAFLLATVVGSGIMGANLSEGIPALALLANSLATGAGLTVLIVSLRPVSGAHFNPVVTLADTVTGNRPWSEVPAYVGAQALGAVAGVGLAHGMFGEALFSVSRQARGGAGSFLSEFIATFGLLVVIGSCSRRRPEAVPYAVGAFIMAAYWFTASTSFANPAVTLARTLTDSFTGIRPADAGPFVIAELLGGAAAAVFSRWLWSPGDR